LSKTAANVVHPGLVATSLVRGGGAIGFACRCMAPIALTKEQGADTALYATLAPELASVSGLYIKKRNAALPNRQARDPILIEEVWAATESLGAWRGYA
jgi:hypothetical protein